MMQNSKVSAADGINGRDSRTHSVAVGEDGFEWNGKTWRSLSAIAREITGAHWSGPRFFGVTGRSPARAGAPVTGHGDD